MSREEVSPEEMMSVAKSMAKGEGLENPDSGDASYYDQSGQQAVGESVSGQTGYSDVSDQHTNYGQQGNHGQQGNANYGQQGADYGQQGGYDQEYDQQGSYDSQPGGYEDVSFQQGGNEDVSDQQGIVEDVSDQQNDYGNGAVSNAESFSQGGNNQNSSYSGASGRSGRQGLQAQGQGFGEGFNQGFGQGLSGDPGGSQPHEGVTVHEEVGPDSASRDTDMHTTGGGQGGGFETHQHHRNSFSTKSFVQGS